MPRPSVIPDIKLRLEAYLNEQEQAYLEQPADSRAPTLPTTPDGKINVRAIAQSIGLKQTQEKYLYERKELCDLVNLMAEGQDILPIGSRLIESANDKAIKVRLTQQAKQSRNASQAAVEAQAAQAELLERLQQINHELEQVKAENRRLRAQIDALHDGLYVEIRE
ncbi:MAG: hypothetical protein WBK19_20495 [Azonexus sp.]